MFIILAETKKKYQLYRRRAFPSSQIKDLERVPCTKTGWIQKSNVPHYYIQVFFDKVYGISFKDILNMIADSDREGIDFFIEQDSKNQNKTTIKINSKIGIELASKVSIPRHNSQMRELDRGRLLFYVTFAGGQAYLNLSNFFQLLNIQEINF